MHLNSSLFYGCMPSGVSRLGVGFAAGITLGVMGGFAVYPLVLPPFPPDSHFFPDERFASRNRVLAGSDASIDSLVRLNNTYFTAFANGHEIPISFSSYIEFKRKSHRADEGRDFLYFVTPDEPELISLADALCTYATPEQNIETVFSYIQKELSYPPNHENLLHFRYPLETAAERTGNCGDRSVLMGTVLVIKGYACALLYYPTKNHVAVGVEGIFTGSHVLFEGKKFFFCDTTGTPQNPFAIGEMPQEYEGLHPEIIPLTHLKNKQ